MKNIALAVAVLGVLLPACAVHAPVPDEPEDTGVARESVITMCPYLDPLSPSFVALVSPVDYARELMITDVSVVDDPCRTTWSGSCPFGGTPGIWTFGELMTRMAGTVSPAVLVGAWLHQWEVPIVVNGFPVPPRPQVRPLVIDPWLVASGCPAGAPITGSAACPLDLQKAPFRLLAIASRPDLACAGYTGVGDGEARFVFGVTGAGGNPIPAAVIFEYKLPPTRFGMPYTAATWENDWHVLSTLPIGSPPYLGQLEALLDDITTPGAVPGAPNLGSAIGQVRTNEIVFGGAPWKLRENRLQNVGAGPNAELLLSTTTAEAPADSMNASPGLDAYLFANSLAGGSGGLANFKQAPVTPSLLGGESSAPLPPPSPSPFWNHTLPSPLLPVERHHFAFNTCNGCHSIEVTTPFLHVGNRAAGSPAVLSPFLTSITVHGGGGMPAGQLNVGDPAGTGAIFSYNEPWRRVCEATRMLGGIPACWSRANGAH